MYPEEDTRGLPDNLSACIPPAVDMALPKLRQEGWSSPESKKIVSFNPAAAKRTNIVYPAVPDFPPTLPDNSTPDEPEGVYSSQIVLYVFLFATFLTCIW